MGEEKYEKHVFGGVGIFDVTIPWDYRDETEVVVSMTTNKGGFFDGTLDRLLRTGEVTAVGERTYRFSAREGVEIQGVASRASALSPDALRLLRGLEEVRSELMSCLRFPDKLMLRMMTYPGAKRHGKTIGFTKDGQPFVTDFPGIEEVRKAAEYFADELLKLKSQLAEALEALNAEIREGLDAKSATLKGELDALSGRIESALRELGEALGGDLRAEAERLKGVLVGLDAELEDALRALAATEGENISALGKRVVDDVNEAGGAAVEAIGAEKAAAVAAVNAAGDAKIEAAAEQARLAGEAKAGAETARAEAERLADEIRGLGATVEEALTEIRGIKERTEVIYEEISKYRYEVVTREDYEARKEAGTLEADVIYFVEGTLEIGKLVKAWYEAGVGNAPEEIAALRTWGADEHAKLAAAIGASNGNFAAAFAALRTRVEGNEAALSESITAEAARAVAKDDELEAAIAREAARAEAKEAELEFACTEEAARAAAKETELADAITAETSRAEDAERVLGETEGEHYEEISERLDAMSAEVAQMIRNYIESSSATTETGGMVKVSTAEVLGTDAGAIGLDENGRVRAAKASATAAGTVKLSTGTVMGVNDAAVGAGSGGALRVASATAEVKGAVYLPDSEASGLGSAAASLELLRTKATASSVECGATASSENCNQYSFVGPLSSLGVTGAAADINSVTFYRRANNTPNGDTQVYLRLLKKVVDADGTAAWQLASQSVNAVAFSAQTENGGKCGTFYMKRVAGVEPPTCAETVALVMVSAADAEVTTGLQFGCKVAASATGGVCLNWGLDLSIQLDKGNSAFVPLVDVTWTPCAPAALEARIAELEARVAALEAVGG